MKTLESYAIPVSALAAAITHAANKDMRYYLNGVYLDFPKGRVVAADGHRLFCGKIERADCDPVIIPRDTVIDAVKAAKKVKGVAILLLDVREDPNNSTNPRRLELVTAGARFRAAELDGQFPKYEEVIPLSPSGEVRDYNPNYLVDADKALATFAGITYKNTGGSKVWHNGASGALITLAGTTALCCIMPVRVDGDSLDIAWFTEKPAAYNARSR